MWCNSSLRVDFLKASTYLKFSGTMIDDYIHVPDNLRIWEARATNRERDSNVKAQGRAFSHPEYIILVEWQRT